MLIASRPLGEMLVERRVLSRDALEELLALEVAEAQPLSQSLIALGLVSEADLLAAVAAQVGLRFVDLSDRSISPDVHAIVPEDVARGYRAVAVERDADGALLVAMEDPTDRQVIDAIAGDTGQRVLPAMAVREQLDRVIAMVYGPADPEPSRWATAGLAETDQPARAPHDLDSILKRALEEGATDVYLSAGAPPTIRRRSVLEPLAGSPALNGSAVRDIVLGMLTRSDRARFEASRQLTTTYSGHGRFRVNLFLQRGTVAAVFRLVPAPPALERLGLPESVRRLPAAESGLVVVTGPRRSGRSTTLAAIVDAINASRPVHVVTVEDPVEFTYPPLRSTVHQFEVGRDTTDFVEGVGVALRAAPDVLLIGRVAEPATARLAIDAAEAGVLVLAGMSAPGAVAAVERLIALAPQPMSQVVRDQLANCLHAVVAQQLVAARDGHLAMAAEVLVGSRTVRGFIREGRPEQLVAAMGVGSDGMQTMEHALARLATIGSISVGTAEDCSAHPEEVRRLVRSSAPAAAPETKTPAPREHLVR